MTRLQHPVPRRCVSISAITLGLLVLTVVAAAPAAGGYEGGGPGPGTAQYSSGAIESCTTIDEPGTYELATSIEDAEATACLRITVSDVTLDGNGHTVDGVDGGEGRVGILVDGPESLQNVTVEAVTTTRWDTGVRMGEPDGTGGERLTLADVEIRDSNTGLHVVQHDESDYRALSLRNNGVGIHLEGASHNEFEGTKFRNNADWALMAEPGLDGVSSTENTFASPDLGFENGSVAVTASDVALLPVPEGERPAPPSRQDDIGVYLNATNTSADGSLDLTVDYPDRAVDSVDESSLSVWRHDGSWSDRGGELDEGTNTLHKNITSFSVFAPLAEPTMNVTVDITSTNAPVTLGDRDAHNLEINATVTNTGDESATQEVTLTVGGEQRDAREVVLEGGESKRIQLSWSTGQGDGGNYTATVASPNDTDATDVSIAHEKVQDGGTFFLGQVLHRDSGVSADETLELVHPDGATTTMFANRNGVATIDTTGLAEGEYSLRGESVDVTFSLVEQTFDRFAFEEETVENEGADAGATLEVSTNRRPTVHYLTATLDGETVGPRTLGEMVGEGSTVDVDDDGRVDVVRVEGTNADEFDLNFSSLAGTGEFVLSTTVPDTTARASATITVGSGKQGPASFASQTISGTAGDVMQIPITFQNAETATLDVGSEDVGYRTTMTVSDADEDGTVTVLWNTHLAGTTDDESAAFEAKGPDTVTSVERTTGEVRTRLGQESYGMRLRVDGTETDVDLATVTDPNNVERSMTIRTAPANVDDLEDARTASSVSSNVAVGDWVIARVETAGIHGYVTDKESLLDNQQGVSMTIEQTSTGPNEDPHTVDLSNEEVQVVTAPEHDALWLGVPVDESGFDTGETYEARFTIDGSNPYVDSTVRVAEEFETEERAAYYYVRRRAESIAAPDSPSAEFAGVTNVAAGTNLTVHVRGEDPESLLQTETVTTDENGHWSTTFDLSGQPDGHRFTTELVDRATGQTLAERPGRIVDTEPPSVAIAASGGHDGPIVFRAEASDPDGTIAGYEWYVDGEVVATGESYEHPVDGPDERVVTVVVTDDDGVTAIARGRSEPNAPPAAEIGAVDPALGETVTVEPDATDPDGSIASYEWVVDGEVVSESRTLSYAFDEPGEHEVTLRVTDDRGASATATRTVEVSGESTDTPSGDGAGEPTDSPTGADGPGFGVLAGLVAIAVLALLRSRRG